MCFLFFNVVSAKEEPTKEERLEKRMSYYLKYESLIVPWYHLAAIDQFERNIQQVRNDIPKKESIIAIQFSDEYWSGTLNPNKKDISPGSLTYFDGKGLDGNGDGYADPNHDEDVLYTMATYLSKYGESKKDFKLALWEYYKSEETVNQIMTIASLYQHFNSLDLGEHVFPIPSNHHYSYKGTWGANRGFGGRRIHEGTDLYANYGVPVVSTSYGIVEVMGWNDYGGWRVGIRDIQNTYHYYAHLGSFNQEIKEGDIVELGTIIGYVGSSGYGKKGTSGRFPPHLHYGMYKYNGRTEWAFDPYPHLRIWEKQGK
ncbi:M23 family metallopeptidase [Paenisporosarcina sp. TG20]|uniref:M23 family metallopeptidase n=1 Tax=Paenisporosarcina sp. TG20 TaxID=1211706 RepID=UPI0006877A9B|nr:M23 family metallopeptidase [Paenisporosarcina sp. TG20]